MSLRDLLAGTSRHGALGKPFVTPHCVHCATTNIQETTDSCCARRIEGHHRGHKRKDMRAGIVRQSIAAMPSSRCRESKTEPGAARLNEKSDTTRNRLTRQKMVNHIFDLSISRIRKLKSRGLEYDVRRESQQAAGLTMQHKIMPTAGCREMRKCIRIWPMVAHS
jgi:hypothetical protein